jgi:hypothetical protein
VPTSAWSIESRPAVCSERVSISALRRGQAAGDDGPVGDDLPLDREDVVTIMGALFDIRADVGHVIRLLQEDDEEEAEEDDA